MGSARPSDLGTRFVALLIDYVIAWAPFLVFVPIGLFIGRSSLIGLLVRLLMLALVVLAWALLVVPMGRTGQTIGGAVMGVAVVDAATGTPIGVGRAFVRYLIFGLMAVPCYLGYLSYFFDKSGYQRGFNDTVANSVAVAAPKVPFGQAFSTALATLRP